MCLLCVQIDKESMSSREIAMAFYELDDKDPHTDEIIKKIEEKDLLEEVMSEVFDIEYARGGAPTK